MEAKDLQIGDWVYNHRKWECPILSIRRDYDSEQYYVMVIARHYGEEEFRVEDLSPIPLTPEILEKNGFIKENRRWTLNDKYTGDEIIALFEVAKGFAMLTSGLAIGFQEVHKLQHLLKLYGIDKEIVL